MNPGIERAGKIGFAPRMLLARQFHHRLLLAALAALCIVVVAIGARLVYNAAHSPTLPTATALEGTWELESLNGETVGGKTSAAILSQRMALREGQVRGETVLRANSEAATVAMPFPDESVTRVVPSADGTALRVLWNGTYQLDDKQQMALHIGKAVYFIHVTWNPREHRIDLNQDAILTIKGVARYHRASSVASDRPANP